MLNEEKLDKEEFIKQKAYLEYCLTQHETGMGKFLVLDNEAGFSKSRLADFAMINSNRKYLLVKKYNNEKEESLKRMQEAGADFFFGEMPEDKVVVVNADNSYIYENEPGYKGKLINAQVVIISHEKYRLLSQSDKQTLYTLDRHTLIIDEYLDVPIITVNDKYFHDYRTLFSSGLGRDEYNSIEDFFKATVEYVRKTKKGDLFLFEIEKNQGKNLFKELKRLQEFLDFHYFELMNLVKNKTIEGKPVTGLTYRNFFMSIESLLKNQCIYASYNNSINTYRAFDFWSLKNNIILDASGNILTEYKLNPRFKIEPQKKVFDYSETTIHIKNYRSYSTRIEKKFAENEQESVQKYCDCLKGFIQNNLKEDDEILIINHRDFDKWFAEFVENEKIHTNWHGNILGKNDWMHCNKLYINTTFNLPEQAYALIYSFYSGKRLAQIDLDRDTSSGYRRFKKAKLESLKQNTILHNFYQTIKRINRDLEGEADIYIITDNKFVLNKLKNMMVNVKILEDYEIELPVEISKYEERPLAKKVDEELKRMKEAEPNNREQFAKALFCTNTGIPSNRLKNTLSKTEYLKKICDNYGLDFRKTFEPGKKYMYFKSRR